MEEGVEKSEEPKDGEVCMRFFQKLHPLKSHQYDCLNLSRTKTTPNGMLAWMGETSMRSQPHTSNYRQARNTENGRERLLQKTAHQPVIQFQVVNLERMHTHNTIQIQQVVFTRLRICIYNERGQEGRYGGGLGERKV